MKRARNEQVHATTLSYLKKRNFTDSESVFRSNYKFEENIAAMAARVVSDSCVGTPDAIAFTANNLEDYFTSFESFRNFVASQAKMQKQDYMQGLLSPVFIQAFLTLMLAGRHSEAEQFYNYFVTDSSISLPAKTTEQLQEMLEANNLRKSLMIPSLRHKFCEVTLTTAENHSLIRFLQAEPDLVIAKLINDRIEITISENGFRFDVDASDQLDRTDVHPDSRSPVKSLIDSKSLSQRSAVTTEAPIILSPPSLASPTSKPTTAPPSGEDGGLSFDMEMQTVRKRIEDVSSTVPAAPQVCLYRFHDKSDSVLHANFSNSEKFVCSGCEDSTVRLWNVSRKVKQSNDSGTAASSSAASDQTADKRRVVDISRVNLGCDFREDVQDRASRASAAQQQDLNTVSFVTSLRGHSGPVYASCFSHNDQFLLTASEDTTIRLWCTTDLTNKTMYPGHNYPVLSLATSTLSMYFASGAYDCTARLWSIERTYPLRTYAGHRRGVQSLAFHGNGSYLATADNTVRLWDVHSGKTVRLMTGHWAPIMDLAFSPNGRLLASAAEDCRIKVWDIASGNLMKELRGHTDAVYSLHFSSDSSLLTSCGADSSIKVWNISESTAAGPQSESAHLLGHWKLGSSNRAALTTRFTANNLLKCICVDR